MRYFITGSAGFIGFHLASRLLREGHSVTGFDGLTPYYDVELKKRRHSLLAASSDFKPIVGMLEDRPLLEDSLGQAAPDVIIHLAAQAGIRYSLENPRAYIETNVNGSWNVIDIASRLGPAHLMLASTSSIYGGNEQRPFREQDRADEQFSLYAATKKAMEAIAHSYSHLYRVPTTSFRFFTVYGPYGRPDMALFKFVSAILNRKPIEIYGHGKMRRDFTYVDDLVEAVVRLTDVAPNESNRVAKIDSLAPEAPYRTVNIGAGQPTDLLRFVEIIEKTTGLTALKRPLPMQAGDVPETFADTALLRALTGFSPQVGIEEGVRRFVAWYHADYAERSHYRSRRTSI